MSSAESVHRLFQTIRPEATKFLANADLIRLTVWLESDVSRLIARYTLRPTFQEHASWAVRELAAGSSSAERGMIDALETAIFDTAKAFVKTLANKRFSTSISAQQRPRRVVSGQTIRFGVEENSITPSQEVALFNEFALQRLQLEEIVRRGRSDLSLIDTKEYFGPRSKPVAIENGIAIQDGSMIVSLQPRIHPVGNFIVQCAAIRLNRWLKLLSSVRAKIDQVASTFDTKLPIYFDAIKAMDNLNTPLDEFRKNLQTGETNNLRDVCMLLTQVYAAFHVVPDLAWLGIPSQIIEFEKVMLRKRVEGFRGIEFFERVDGAIILLGKYFGDKENHDSAKFEAIERGDFVVEVASRLFHWEKKRTDFSGRRFNAVWEILVELSRKAKLGQHLSESDIFDQVVSKGALATRVERLNKALPIIRKYIVSGPVARTYRLKLDSHRIHIFE